MSAKPGREGTAERRRSWVRPRHRGAEVNSASAIEVSIEVQVRADGQRVVPSTPPWRAARGGGHPHPHRRTAGGVLGRRAPMAPSSASPSPLASSFDLFDPNLRRACSSESRNRSRKTRIAFLARSPSDHKGRGPRLWQRAPAPAHLRTGPVFVSEIFPVPALTSRSREGFAPGRTCLWAFVRIYHISHVFGIFNKVTGRLACSPAAPAPSDFDAAHPSSFCIIIFCAPSFLMIGGKNPSFSLKYELFIFPILRITPL